jgi:hypothetical protein
MSYLTLPRITFMGNVYANPSTANNNDYANVFNIDTLQINPTISPIQGAKVIYPEGAPQNFTFTGPQDASDLRSWLMGVLTGIDTGDGGPYGQPAHWNYYGDSSTRFENTSVTGYEGISGSGISSTDPLLGATVEILGNEFFNRTTSPVMVDVDPYALITSQIFTASLRITGKDGSTVLLSASPATRAYAYFIYPFKNLDPNAIGFEMVSAIFIFSVPSGSGLQINPANVNSPALADLAQAVAAGAGLNVRYCFYDAIYQTAPQDLAEDYRQQKYIPNPYRGKVLGTVGVLAPGELQTAPMGRKLYVQNKFPYTLGPECGQSGPAPVPPPAPIRYHIRTGVTQPTAPPPTANLGVTAARVDTQNRTVTLELISTFPECNVKTNHKLNLGPMQLNLVYGANQRVTIGSIAYDQETYENTGGVSSVSWADNPERSLIDQNIAGGALTIFAQQLNQDLLLEVPGIDIQTDDRAIYFQENGSASLTIQVFSKGLPVQAATPVNLEYWMCAKDFVNPNKPMVPVTTPYFSVTGASHLPNTTYTTQQKDKNGNNITLSVITDQVIVPANAGGKLNLNLTSLNPGVSVIRFVDPGTVNSNHQGSVLPNFAWDNAYFSTIRILPVDDYSSYTDEQINNWPFMFEHVFCYFSLLYPIMSTLLPWGPDNAPNNPGQVKEFAANIVSFTNPASWNSTLYMPITRELSAGKRALLVRWANLQ